LTPSRRNASSAAPSCAANPSPQEVRDAVDLYLHLPVSTEEELKILARMAKESADRSIARLDETIAYIDRELKAMRKPR
jgi:hypothetical protein